MSRVQVEFPVEALVHRHVLSVRITDMNHGRHLGHDTLVSLLHEARVAAFSALGFNEWDIEGHASVVADLAIQYLAEARWPDTLSVETAIPAAEGKALVVYHRVSHQSDLRTVARARVTLLLLDSRSGRPVSIPPGVSRALAERSGG